MDAWRYRETHPEEGGYFDRAMRAMTRTLSSAVGAAYDWSRFGVIADIGGGHGGQLAAVLARCPSTRGILFDQPHVVQGAPAVLQNAGVADRCEVVSGSFFDSVPRADAYMLKNILHDWYDDDCVRLLKTIHAAAPDDARLLIIERVIEGPNLGADTKSSDLNMLVGPGGMERTREEFEELLSTSGWRFVATHPAASQYIIDGVPA